jgi:hypothetical protein
LTAFLFLAACQVQVSESTPGANVCGRPDPQMLADYENNVENQVILGICFECHNVDGVARRLSYSSSMQDNFCIVYALGPNDPNRKIATYPFSQGHIAESGKTFTAAQLQPLTDWVNKYSP